MKPGFREVNAPPAAPVPPAAARTVVGTVRAPRACGHEDEYKILANEPPDFAKGRRAKWDRKRCLPCAQAVQDAQSAAATERRAAKALAKKDGQAHTPRFRLPDGSVFTLAYHATDPSHGMWRGTLTVPEREASFVAEDDGVHRLLRALGQQWRIAEGAVQAAEEQST